MTDDKLKAGEVDSRPMQGQRRVNTVPDSPHGIEAGRPLSTIPDWIVEYDKKNFQSSAGKAIRILINHAESLQAENERLKKELTENRVTWALWIKQHEALQSKLDRVKEYCEVWGTVDYESRRRIEILDLLK